MRDGIRLVGLLDELFEDGVMLLLRADFTYNQSVKKLNEDIPGFCFAPAVITTISACPASLCVPALTRVPVLPRYVASFKSRTCASRRAVFGSTKMTSLQMGFKIRV